MINNYIDLVRYVMNNGEYRPNRTGINTYSCFGTMLEYDISEHIPLIQEKYVPYKLAIRELLFFLSGKSNTKILEKQGVYIWKANTTREFLDNKGLHNYPIGDMGPSYSFNFRHYGAEYIDSTYTYEGEGYDQVHNLELSLRDDPYGRRHIINLWNPAELDKMALPPCLYSYQFYVSQNKLSLMCNMRSVDVFLGLPFNLFESSLLVYMLCHVLGYEPGTLRFSMGDTHIYETHMKQCRKLLENHDRMELDGKYNIKPQLYIYGEHSHIYDIEEQDIIIKNYKHMGQIKADMAI